MFDRFKHESRVGRGKIPKQMREAVFARDAYTCQFCGTRFEQSDLTIDHLIPLALGGLDEITNYVTACEPCNGKKAAMPLAEFARQVNVALESLPVHGDPIIDNPALPVELRIVRRNVYNRMREGRLSVTGRQAQKKLEKHYRSSFWETTEGKKLEAEFPFLPGHARIMLPEIQAIANGESDFVMLLELAKSATTRNLIGTVLSTGCDVMERLNDLQLRSKDVALTKRIAQAKQRHEAAMRARGRGSEA